MSDKDLKEALEIDTNQPINDAPIQPKQPTTQIPEFVPFMISMNTPEELASCFEGPIPVIGDSVEFFCYGMVGNSRMFKWRVVKKGE